MLSRRRCLAVATTLLLIGCKDGAGVDPGSVRIVFQAMGSGSLDLLSVNATGDTILTLLGTAASEIHPAYSPDRSRIVFVHDGRLWLVNSDGSNAHSLGVDTVPAAYPSWSRDGSLIAFRSARKPSGGTAIWVVTPSGTGLKQITSLDVGEDFSTWTADGRVVFDGPAGYLRIVGANGGVPQFIFTDTSYIDRHPAISPDGQRIAFVRDTLVNGFQHQRIYVANLHGTGAMPVSRFSAGNDWSPAWSPDGARIVFAHDEDPNYDLWIVNADGSNQHLLAHRGGSYRPAW